MSHCKVSVCEHGHQFCQRHITKTLKEITGSLKLRVIDQIDLEIFQLVKGANDSCMQFLKKEMSFSSLIFLSKGQTVL